MSDILLLTKPDGEKIHVVKAMIVTWPDNSSGPTLIQLAFGTALVTESADQIHMLYTATPPPAAVPATAPTAPTAPTPPVGFINPDVIKNAKPG